VNEVINAVHEYAWAELREFIEKGYLSLRLPGGDDPGVTEPMICFRGDPNCAEDDDPEYSKPISLLLEEWINEHVRGYGPDGFERLSPLRDVLRRYADLLDLVLADEQARSGQSPGASR
jgi:hypothetical protein